MSPRQDPSGSIHGYLHEGLIEEYGPDLVPGFAIALSKVTKVVDRRFHVHQLEDQGAQRPMTWVGTQVSLLISGPGVQRWLNITPMNVIGFFPKSLEADRTMHERWKEAAHQQEPQLMPGRLVGVHPQRFIQPRHALSLPIPHA
jgi:hypothetical protein